MKRYHIAEMEQLSGIKAPTIRMWEKRYGLIEPWRTDTNIRMYDDSQVKKLLNVAALLSGGQKISAVAALSEQQLRDSVLLLSESEMAGSRFLSVVNHLIIAVLDLDENEFHQIFDAAVTAFGMDDTMLKIVYPFLRRLGILWVTDNAVPVQEHFASALVRRKLLTAIEKLTMTRRRRKRFLLLLPPDEWHEIGLMFSDYMIRSRNIETIYLGQNVPYENVGIVLSRCSISHVLLFIITPPLQDNVTCIREKMGLLPHIPLLIAGNASYTSSILGKDIVFLDTPYDLLPFL